MTVSGATSVAAAHSASSNPVDTAQNKEFFQRAVAEVKQDNTNKADDAASTPANAPGRRLPDHCSQIDRNELEEFKDIAGDPLYLRKRLPAECMPLPEYCNQIDENELEEFKDMAGDPLYLRKRLPAECIR